MKSFPNLARNTQKGFTLIEVLIVVIVLGLISAIAVPAFNNSIERAASVKLIGSVTDNIADATSSLLITTGLPASTIGGTNGVATATAGIATASNTLLDVLVEGKSFVKSAYKNDYEDASIAKLDRQIEITSDATAGTAGAYNVGGYVMQFKIDSTTPDDIKGQVVFSGVPGEVVERIERDRGDAVTTTDTDDGLKELTIAFDL